MSTVEHIAKIREEAGEDVYKKIDPVLNEITRSLRETEVKLESKKTEYNALYKEMKEAKEKKSEVQKELDKAQAKVTELESDDSVSKVTKENTDLKAKNEVLQKTVDGVNKNRKERFVSSFKSYADHSDFEQIKAMMKIPEADDGKEIDWTKVPEEEIFSNLAIIEKAESFGLFKDRKKSLATSRTSEKDIKTKGTGYFKDDDFKE